MNQEEQSVFQREIEFHDEWAASMNPEDVPVAELFESRVALENRHILKRIGELKGKRVLDIGAGLGESSVYFAQLGAEVTMTDISPGMVDFAVRLGEYHGVTIHGVVSAAEQLKVENESYDIVYAANLIHHVTDKDQFFRNAARALKARGRFFSWDPLAYNPVINRYRKMATEVRSDDEMPLTFKDLRLAEKYFSHVRHREFWIATLLLFLKFYLIDKVHPNEDRYWKRIFKHAPAAFWWYPLCCFDAIATRTPLLRRLAWNMVIEAIK